MNNFKTLALCALLTPAVGFSIGAVAAPGDDTREGGYERHDRHERSGSMSGTKEHGEYLSAAPKGAVSVDDMLSSSLHMRNNDGDVGSINDLIIDESGQIIAVIVDVGGFLGIGQRSVAVSWDSVERTVNEDGDGYRFSVDANESALREAPAYDKDSKGVRSRSSQ